MLQMRGYCILGKGKTGWRNDLPEPVPKPNDCVIKPIAVCPCTSDIHIVDTLPPSYSYCIGAILGHEGIGVVTEVGSEVRNFRPGDRVAGLGMFMDFRSLDSQAGLAQYNPADSYPDRLAKFGGTFAERVYVYEADANLALIPDNVSDKQAVMITDMMSTPFTQAELANINYGDTVAVFGVGPVGLMAICAARLKGAGRVIAVGSRKICFDRALIYGVSDLVNYKNGDIVEQIMELTKGKKVDAVLCCGGGSEMIAKALRIVKFGGTVSNVALFWGEDNTVLPNIDWGFGCCEQKTITGTQVKGGRYWTEKMLDLVSYGRVDPSHLCSQEYYGFDKIEEAYFKMSEKTDDLIKPVVFINDL
jgi:threonine dehydrogenase-like Zn-dependent dehydrogenase